MLAPAATSTINFTPKLSSHPDPWGGLDERVASAAVRKLAAKEHLFVEGDAKTHVYKVEAGTLLLYKILPDAKRQVIDIAFPGDLVGLGGPGEHGFSALTTEPTRVRCLPASVLHQLAARDPAIGMKLYEAVSLELDAARTHMLAIGMREAGARLASFLLALAKRNERQGRDATEFVIPVRRADIADFLGLTIETVSRTFTKLKAGGLVDIGQCGYVRIIDAAALKEVADGLQSVA